MQQTVFKIQRTNYENDWKLVTIFIGGNDLCALQSNDGRPQKYIEYLEEALDILHAEVNLSDCGTDY